MATAAAPPETKPCLESLGAFRYFELGHSPLRERGAPLVFFDSSAALMLSWLTSHTSILRGPSFLVTPSSFASMAVWSVLLLMLCFQHLKMARLP